MFCNTATTHKSPHIEFTTVTKNTHHQKKTSETNVFVYHLEILKYNQAYTISKKLWERSIFMIQFNKMSPEGLGVNELFKFHTYKKSWSTVIHGVDWWHLTAASSVPSPLPKPWRLLLKLKGQRRLVVPLGSHWTAAGIINHHDIHSHSTTVSHAVEDVGVTLALVKQCRASHSYYSCMKTQCHRGWDG